MYSIKKTKSFLDQDFSVDKILNVVVDVQEYKNFVPWCTDVVIIENKINTENYFVADLFLEVMSMKHHYRSTTHITSLEHGASIVTTGTETNIIKYLKSQWHISEIDNNIVIDYTIDIDLKINIPFLPVEKLLHAACDKIIASFEKRIKIL